MACWSAIARLVALLPPVQMVLATRCSKLATCCSAVVKLATCCIMWRSRWRPVAACGGHAGELLQPMEVTLVICCSAVSLLVTWQFVAMTCSYTETIAMCAGNLSLGPCW